MHTPPTLRARILGLDIVRAVAILCVLAAHFLGIYRLGVLGVEIFFVLSGFLIGRILCKDVERAGFARLDILHFWRRRWYRTLPNYFACLAVMVVAVRLMNVKLEGRLWQYLLFVQNLARGGDSAFFPTSWSLCVEEWAYLILPISISCALLIRSNRNRRGILVGALIIVAVPTLLRLGFAPKGSWDFVIRKMVAFRIDAIGYGVLLAYAAMFRKDLADRLKSPALASLGAIGVFALYWNLGRQIQGPHGLAVWRNTLWLSASSICLVPIIAYAGTVVWSRNWMVRVVAPIISTYSYSLYLWHLLVVIIVTRYWRLYHGHFSKLLELLVLTIGTCALSWAAYHLIEKPFMDLRERKENGGQSQKQSHWSRAGRLVGS